MVSMIAKNTKQAVSWLTDASPIIAGDVPAAITPQPVTIEDKVPAKKIFISSIAFSAESGKKRIM